MVDKVDKILDDKYKKELELELEFSEIILELELVVEKLLKGSLDDSVDDDGIVIDKVGKVLDDKSKEELELDEVSGIISKLELELELSEIISELELVVKEL